MNENCIAEEKYIKKDIQIVRGWLNKIQVTGNGVGCPALVNEKEILSSIRRVVERLDKSLGRANLPARTLVKQVKIQALP